MKWTRLRHLGINCVYVYKGARNHWYPHVRVLVPVAKGPVDDVAIQSYVMTWHGPHEGVDSMQQKGRKLPACFHGQLFVKEKILPVVAPCYWMVPLMIISCRVLWRSAPIGQNFQPKTRLFAAIVGTPDKMKNQYQLENNKWKNKNQLEFSGCQVFSKGLRVPKKLDLRKTPLTNNVSMLATISFVHPMLEVLQWISLGWSALLHCNLNLP